MAKIRPQGKRTRTNVASQKRSLPQQSKSLNSPHSLILEAEKYLQQGDLESAIPVAKRALSLVNTGTVESLPSLNLLGQIYVEHGDIDLARKYFTQAAEIDKDGTISEELGGGADKFLWLAQLSEEGGHDSMQWFEKGATSLRRQLQEPLGNKPASLNVEMNRAEISRKLAVCLCSMVEVHMTDLSWEDNAEQSCETLVTEATMVAPGLVESWQTLANVRISQQRMEDARAALNRSLSLWLSLPPQDPKVPEYSSRVSLVRLLMEADMDTEAIQVLERLVSEDDSSVEVWYLGGWCLYNLGLKQKSSDLESCDRLEDWKSSWVTSKQWLEQALLLFNQQSYEDERLGEHAKELVENLSAELGGVTIPEDEEEWTEYEEDEEMTEA
ncbi:unnamed protein product [Blumeria hordei]|uniref:Uncharacterized protein n=2 Tax=Blumeria hordei TaxID=2867405 RepID=A0A383UJH6_BLUHO|nr:TPR domain protein [Blumeria hordei DH14]SZE99387.1 unnamed protein product [Blumeria hordei]